MLTALSVAHDSLIVGPQDKILMASVSLPAGESQPSLIWCPIENRPSEKSVNGPNVRLISPLFLSSLSLTSFN